MTIDKRPLGRTGVEVTILSYGAFELRDQPRGPAIDDAEAGRLLNIVLDSGISLIDTAVDYGRSEELIGRHIASRRDEYLLASKCGCTPDLPQSALPPYAHDYRPENIRAGVEQSLRKLDTDHLDLLQVHIAPSRAQLEKDRTIETMISLRDEGKLRFIGVSGTLPNLSELIEMRVFDVVQIPYSAIQYEHEALITAAFAQGAGTLIRSGAVRGGPGLHQNWRVDPIGLPEEEGRRRWDSSGVEAVIGSMSRLEFYLRFTLSHPHVSSTIVGTSKVEHLLTNVAVAEKGPLPRRLYEEAKDRLRGQVPTGTDPR